MLRLSIRGSTLYRACYGVGFIVLVWTVFSVLALAFQCGLQQPWVYTADRCLGRGALWYPVVLLNLLTDLVIATLFIPVIRTLQMDLSRQLKIGSMFGSRIL
jgi:hypothetical protein